MPVRIFISEFVTGGGWSEEVTPVGLAAEGKAMLLACVEDFSRIPGCDVLWTWDERLGNPPVSAGHVAVVSGPQEESNAFEQAARQANATLVIAPEFDSILLNRVRRVEQWGGQLLGPNSQAVNVCSDKLRTAETLTSADVRVVPTFLLENHHQLAPQSRYVVKPRDGAGSSMIATVHGSDVTPARCGRRDEIWQPFVEGVALSVSLLASEDRQRIDVMPTGLQRLSNDGLFRYQGGLIPADISPSVEAEIDRLTRRSIEAIPGLKGYVGFDLLLPADGTGPTIVEINPRMTTSYLGYRRLGRHNLAEAMFRGVDGPLEWRTEPVEFAADGSFAAISSSFVERTKR